MRVNDTLLARLAAGDVHAALRARVPAIQGYVVIGLRGENVLFCAGYENGVITGTWVASRDRWARSTPL